MKAILQRRYGPPSVLRLENVPKPEPGEGEVLIRVHAATVGTWDSECRSFSFPLWFWLPLRIVMGIRRPRRPILGQELSGVIERVGSGVTDFKPGDAVFAATGLRFGAHAEYTCLPARGPIAHKPHNMSHEQAAGIPTGGDNALHFLRMAKIKPGEHVLVNGAGANIGVMAVQIARHFGAEVTAVDHASKLAMLREIGATHVLDYTKESYADRQQKYDVIFDLVFKSSYSDCVNSLRPGGRYLLANPRFWSMLRAGWTTRTTDKTVMFRFAGARQEDLVRLADLAEAGAIRAVIDRTYPLERAAEAHAYVDTGMRKGTVVLKIYEDRGDRSVEPRARGHAS